jgi:hypothetical protein
MIGAVPLQDLLPDEASRFFIGLLRLAMSLRTGRYWAECQEALVALRGIGPDDAVRRGSPGNSTPLRSTAPSATRPRPVIKPRQSRW